MIMENENQPAEVEETLDLPEVAEGEEDTTDWKAEAQKLRDKAISQRERTRMLKREVAEAKAEAKKLAETTKSTPNSPKTGELDDTVLDYFDVKGYTESDELDVFKNIMQKTGMSAREVLKDEYALAKVKAIRDARAVKDAITSATKRGGGQTNDLERAISDFEKTGKLPDDFEFRTKVVNAIANKDDVSKPRWQRG